MRALIAALLLAVTAAPATAAAPSYPPSLPPSAVATDIAAGGTRIHLGGWMGERVVRVRWRQLGGAGATGSVDVRVDASGKGMAVLPLGPGSWLVTATGLAEDGEPTVVTLEVNVPGEQTTAPATNAPSPTEPAAEARGALAETGFPVAGWVAAALALTVVGFGLAGAGRRR